MTDPHRSPLDKDADPNDPASYAKYTQKEYANDLIFDELLKFVSTNQSTPFFLMWTTPLPHVSLQAPERWVKYYVEKFGDEEPYTGKAGYLPCRYPHATYAAMISYFDEQIGGLIEKLKKKTYMRIHLLFSLPTTEPHSTVEVIRPGSTVAAFSSRNMDGANVSCMRAESGFRQS